MHTIEIKTFKFSELSTSVQNKVLDNFRDVNIEHYEWYDAVKEDFHNILELIGCYNIESQFSGFHSQGDGACFKADYSYTKGCLKVIKEYAPQDKELHNIVQGIVSHQKDYAYKLECEIYTQGNYSHSNTMYFNWSTNNSYDFEFRSGFVEAELNLLFKDLADWYYSKLESEYEYLTSDDAVKEMILCNDYDFLETGEQFYQ